MPRWKFIYDDESDQFAEVYVSGKLSLDTSWAFVIDPTRQPSAIVLAIPKRRIVSISISD